MGYDMLIRILSALIGIPLMVYIVYKGGLILIAAVTLLTLLGLKEFYDVFNKAGIFPFRIVGSTACVAIIILAGMQGEESMQVIPLILVASLALCFLIMVFKRSFKVIDLGITLFGIVYVAFLLSMVLVIYDMHNGFAFLWLIFIIAWSGDTVAYFSGLALGKHRLCPTISPKKSIEGAIGGLIGSILGSLLFGLAMHKWLGSAFNPVSYIAVGLVGGCFAQIGDLSASIIKRFAGVKDYGNIIPGHGGVLDRFDSILFTVPVVYFYVKYFL